MKKYVCFGPEPAHNYSTTQSTHHRRDEKSRFRSKFMVCVDGSAEVIGGVVWRADKHTRMIFERPNREITEWDLAQS